MVNDLKKKNKVTSTLESMKKSKSIQRSKIDFKEDTVNFCEPEKINGCI